MLKFETRSVTYGADLGLSERYFSLFFCERLGLKGMATKQKWYFKLAGDTIGRGFDSSIVLEVWGISREYCFLHSAHFPVN